MKVFKHELHINSEEKMIAITDIVRGDIEESGIYDGTVTVMCPHTTAAVTVSENTDPNVQQDMLNALERIFPRYDNEYLHEDGNSFAHIKSAVIGVSQSLIVENGRLILGIWQDLYFCEWMFLAWAQCRIVNEISRRCSK